MNFSNVKSLTIPEGEVKQISVNNTVLWQKSTGMVLVDYLQFNADMVFDTNVVCTQDTKIEIEFTRESSGGQYLYGVRNSANTASVTAYLATSGAWRFGNTYRNFTLATGSDEIHSMIVDENGYLLNGTKYSFSGTLKSFTANATLVVGSTRSTGGAYSSPQYVGKIYSFKMYDNGNLILDWQPCKLGDEYGFYDNVKQIFIRPI